MPKVVQIGPSIRNL